MNNMSNITRKVTEKIREALLYLVGYQDGIGEVEETGVTNTDNLTRTDIRTGENIRGYTVYKDTVHIERIEYKR